MADLVGKTISHYRITEQVGQGGMGVVYKAEDTNLQRLVAIKFLQPDLTRDQQANERFIHEARAASTLDHPNVGTIYEVDRTEDGQMFIVMAYYEGETLKDKVTRGQLSLDEVLYVASQVSQGLSKAHSKGIVHRDIKPANILITEDGHVKIVDFGLAKLAGRTQLTKAGTTMGTVAYMSPEQAQGKVTDHRTDIWALGVILYEMLTRQQPFQGEYEQAVMYAIVNEEPEPITGLRTGVSIELERDVFKCLEKAPEERYQSATELLVDLKKLKKVLDKGERGSVAVATGEVSRQQRKGVSVTNIAMLGLALILAIVAYFNLRPKDRVPRLSNPRQITTTQGQETNPTWSPAGDRLAYHSNQKGNLDIWVSQVGGGPAVNLTEDHLGTDFQPRWSPDGNQIAFSSARDGRGVFIVPALGGIPLRVTSGTYPQWSQDGTKLASIVDDITGVFVEIVTLENSLSKRIPLPGNQRSRFDLSWSPDERAVAYGDGFRASGAPEAQLWVLTLADGEGMPVTDRLSHARSPSWSADGRFLYYVSTHSGTGDLWQQRMSADYRPEGPPEPLTTGISMNDAVFSPDGAKLAYSQSRGVANIWRFPIPGSHEPPATWADAQQLTFYSSLTVHADVSPDGRRLLFSSDRGGNFDIWKMSLTDGSLQQLTTDPALEFHARWSPNGKEVVFHSSRGGNRDIWVMPANGGRAQQLTRHEGSDMRPVWSRDGQEIAFQSNRSGYFDIWVIPSMGGEARQVTFHPADDQWPQWSPDGKWLLFASKGDADIWRLWRVPTVGGRPELLTEEHARAPLRPRSGKQMYFLRDLKGNRSVWELSIEGGRERQVLDVRGRSGQLGPDAFGSDGDQLFLSWVEDIGDIWVMDVEWE